MTVIKRDRQSSSQDLVAAIGEFSVLLADQGEQDAVDVMRSTAQKLKTAQPGTPGHKEAISVIIDAFEGDFELNAYILAKSDPNKWDVAEQLSQAAVRVLNLAKRLR